MLTKRGRRQNRIYPYYFPWSLITDPLVMQAPQPPIQSMIRYYDKIWCFWGMQITCNQKAKQKRKITRPPIHADYLLLLYVLKCRIYFVLAPHVKIYPAWKLSVYIDCIHRQQNTTCTGVGVIYLLWRGGS